MRRNTIDLSKARRLSEETFATWTRRLVPEAGDLLFAREAPVGPVVRIPEGGNIAAGQRTTHLRADPNVVDARFLYYLMISPVVQSRIAARVMGSTVGHLRVADVKSLQLPPLPSLPLQIAVSAVLGSLDDKIAANGQLALALEDLASAEFEFARSSAVGAVGLADIVTTQYGLTTSAHSAPGPKFLRVTDINKNPWVNWEAAPNCSVDEAELSKYRVVAGDILVARMADPGKAGYVDEHHPEAVFASYLVRLKSVDPSNALYIYYFLRSSQYKRYAASATQGTVQKNMNAKVIVATDIPMPTTDRIARFTESAEPLRRSVRATQVENRKLAELRDTLLPELMSGRLRVKDAEKKIEEVM